MCAALIENPERVFAAEHERCSLSCRCAGDVGRHATQANRQLDGITVRQRRAEQALGHCPRRRAGVEPFFARARNSRDRQEQGEEENKQFHSSRRTPRTTAANRGLISSAAARTSACEISAVAPGPTAISVIAEKPSTRICS